MNSKNQINAIGKPATRKRSASQRFRDVAKIATTPMKQHTPNDAVYLLERRFGCPFCIKTGTPKVYKNLWKLRYHFRQEHDFSFSCHNLIEDLVNLIERKVIL